MSIIEEYFTDIVLIFEKGEPVSESDREEVIALMDQIRVELVVIPPGPRRAEILERLKGYQTKVEKNERMALLGNGQEKKENRSQAQISNDALAILHESRRQLYETEECANKTAEELKRQTEVMGNSNKNMIMTNEELGYSNKLLQRMGQWWRG